MDKLEIKNSSELEVPAHSSQISSGSYSNLLKVNADNLQPKKTLIMKIIIAVVILLIFFLKFALPKEFIILNNQLAFSDTKNKTCNPTQYEKQTRILKCVQFSSEHPKLGLLMRNVTNLNQLCLMYFKVIHKVNQTNVKQLNQIMYIQEALLNAYKSQSNNQIQYRHRQKVFQQLSAYVYSDSYLLGSQKLQSSQGTRLVNKYYFAYNRISPELKDKFNNFILIIKFSNYSQINQFQSLSLQALTINPNFTVFTVVLRVVLCIVSVISFIFYTRRYLQLKKEDRILQIKLTIISSFLLILFNDPMYAITVMLPNPVTTFLSLIYVIVFLVFLQFLWIFMLRRIYFQQGQKSTKLFRIKQSWPHYLFIFLIFVFSITLFCQYAYYSLLKVPIIQYADLQKIKVIPIIVVLAILMSIVVIYQIIMIALIIKKYVCSNNSQKITQRNKNYLTIYPFFLIMFILCFCFGGAMPFSYQSAWIFYQYCFMNIFIFIMQYFYYTPLSSLEGEIYNQNVALEKISQSSQIQISNKNNNKNISRQQKNTAQQQVSQSG